MFRFRLRTIFILLTLVSLGFGYIAWFEAPYINPRQRIQEKLAEDLEKAKLDGGLGAIYWEELPLSPLSRLLQRKPSRKPIRVYAGFKANPEFDKPQIDEYLSRIDTEQSIPIVWVGFDGDSIGPPKRVPAIPSFTFPQNTETLLLSYVAIDEDFVESMEKHGYFSEASLVSCQFVAKKHSELQKRLCRRLASKNGMIRLEYLELSTEGVSPLRQIGECQIFVVLGCEFLDSEGNSSLRMPGHMVPLGTSSLIIASQELTKELANAIKECQSLTELRIVDCTFESAESRVAFSDMLTGLPLSLRCLRVDINYQLSSDDIAALGRYQSLRELIIKHQGEAPSSDVIVSLSSRLEYLELEVEDWKGWLQAIVNRPLPKNLYLLDSGFNGDEALEGLVEAMENNSPRFNVDAQSGVFSDAALQEFHQKNQAYISVRSSPVPRMPQPIYRWKQPSK